MATCVESLPCDDCGSPAGVQVYLNVDEALGVEWYTSFCHSACWEQKGDPYVGKPPPAVHVKTEEERRSDLAVVQNCPRFMPKDPYRGIKPETLRSWGLRLLYSEYDGKTPYAIGFPYSKDGELWAYKIRPLANKKFFAMGLSMSVVDLFGIKRALSMHGDTLYITEGEFDAMALEDCMSMVKWGWYPVVSAPNGGGSLLKVLQEYDKDGALWRRWQRIALVLDDDEVGKQAEEAVIAEWPERDIVVVNKPKHCKDANDALKKGYGLAMGRAALKQEL